MLHDHVTVGWLKGTIEDVPLGDGAVEVALSNCLINLSVDKSKVMAECSAYSPRVAGLE
jgi:hypothetical protein